MNPRFFAILMAALVIALPFASAIEETLSYDANGNLVTGDGKYRVYNSLNQLTVIYNGTNTSGMLLESYVYDPVEERIAAKITYNPDASVKETVFYVSQEFVRVVNTTGTYDYTYIYHEGQLVAQTVNETTLFIHANHEGSSSVVTNESGHVVERTQYTPYGETLNSSRVRYGYEGKEADSLVGDTDFNFRKYKPAWGMFTQPDDTIQNVYDPQSLNRYTFEKDNPTKYRDDNGHNPVAFFAAYVGVISATVYWVQTPITPETNMGDRLGKGLAHGSVAAGAVLLAPQLAVSGGAVRVATPSLLGAGRAAIAGVGAEFWNNNIDGARVSNSQLAVTAVAAAAISYLPGLAQPGQYAATRSFYSPQNWKMLGDVLAAASAAEAINIGWAWLTNRYQSSDYSNQACMVSPARSDSTSRDGSSGTSSSGSGRSGGDRSWTGGCYHCSTYGADHWGRGA